MTAVPDDWSQIHFEVRQAQWTGVLRQFRQLNGRADRPTVWEIWVEGDRYFTRHGLLGGKMQETSKQGKAKNEGRSNALSPAQDALAEARRLCRKKWDFEGFDEFVGDENLDNRALTGEVKIPWLLEDLPGSFCLYKPQNNIEGCKGLLKKAEAGGVLYTLKRNGLAMWVVVDVAGAIHLYSRRNRKSHKDEGPKEQADGTLAYDTVIPWTARFPHLVRAVQALNLPPHTMLAVELVHPGGDTKAHFAHVESVEQSLTPRALALQQDRGWLGLYWWDVPFYEGKDLVSTRSVRQRYSLLTQLRDLAVVNDTTGASGWIQPIRILDFRSVEDAVAYAKTHHLEGWVVVDPDGIYGDQGWNLKGKPDRPGAFCAKAKPWYEDDFVLLWNPAEKWGTWGKGRHEPGKTVTLPSGESVVHGGVGSVGLGQYNEHGELVYISDCSSGLSYEVQAQLTSQSFPLVAEVAYTERSFIHEGDATNALTFAKVLRLRTDKAPSECVLPALRSM